jgi:hypothetical protein
MSRKTSKVVGIEAAAKVANAAFIKEVEEATEADAAEAASTVTGAIRRITAEELPVDIALPPLAEDVTSCALSDRAKYYLQVLISQYIGVDEAEATAASHVETVESGLQLIVFNNPLRVVKSDLPFDCTDTSKDAVSPDILLNLSRQLANVRMYP